MGRGALGWPWNPTRLRSYTTSENVRREIKLPFLEVQKPYLLLNLAREWLILVLMEFGANTPAGTSSAPAALFPSPKTLPSSANKRL